MFKMIKVIILVISVCLSVVCVSSKRILVVVPTPSISHQVVFRPLIQELLKHGHDVTSITTDPMYPEGQTPANFTEIDLHDLSYKTWQDAILSDKMTSGNDGNLFNQIKTFNYIITEIIEKQIQHPEVNKIIFKPTQFDLLILEAWVRPALLFTHVYKNVPVILVSSLGGVGPVYERMGAPSRPPLIYPTVLRQKLTNLSLMEKIIEFYNHLMFESIYHSNDEVDDNLLRKLYGPEVPSVRELEKNVDMLFLSLHPLWDMNRPVPPSVLYMGGMHQNPAKELPQELKQYLDSSKHGVIYISYGTNVSPSHLPPEKIQMLVNVFSKLRYDVLWKWDKDELPGRSKNIRISKWLPQSDLLKHPNVKLFITQGGLQSTDEAITAGVPLIGMPMLGDQWFNVEHYVIHKVGVRVDMDTLTEEKFMTAVNTVIDDESYRKNMERLRAVMHDQPQTALERAVWWTEHLLRHGSGKHLRAPAANMTWAEYLDLELLAVLGLGVLAVITAVVVALVVVVRTLKKVLGGGSKKIKRS